MAEIDRQNYPIKIAEIKELLRKCTFVCFDAEFSGLGQPAGDDKNSLFDSGEERYQKLKNIVQQNTSPQIGLSIFRRDFDESKNLFHVEAYQAFVTEPRFADFNNQHSGHNNVVISLEYKCAKFLRKCNFDFNAFAERSVPCLNKTKLLDLKNYLYRNPHFMTQNDAYFDKLYFPETKSFESYQEQNELIQRLRGLSEIIDTISEYKIPIVGHNLALDFLYIISLMCDELPNNYNQFKAVAQEYFPHVYDTKFMILNCRKILTRHPAFKNNEDKDKLQSSSLYTAYQQTSMVQDKFSPQIIYGKTCTHFRQDLDLGRNVDLEVAANNLVHSPAFDACATGVLFLNIAHIAARIDKNFMNRIIPPSRSELFENVQSWKDQIFIGRASILAMYLQGSDPTQKMQSWTEVHSDFKIDTYRLNKDLCKIGPVDIRHINDKTFRFIAANGNDAKLIKRFLIENGFLVKNRKASKPLGSRLTHDKYYDLNKLLGNELDKTIKEDPSFNISSLSILCIVIVYILKNPEFLSQDFLEDED